MIEMRFGRQVTGDLGAAAAREWLVGDGLGGFAMGTAAGLRTRRYHGLLVVAGGRSPGPRLALAALEAHLAEWGLGSVSETADGDPPHAATGCPFQAWSVAEVLRARRRLDSRPPG